MFKTQNLYQNDEKWKDIRLGNSSETIGGWGCLLTSATMILNGIGYRETPESVNEKMKSAGGFQGAFFIPSVLPYIWPNCAYRDMQPCESAPAPIAQIDKAVAEGKPVILQVDWNQQVGVQTHFVLVREKRGNDYVIYDPYKYPGDSPDKEVLLTRRYKYNGARLETEISAVLWFDSYGVVAEPPRPAQLPVPADCLTVYAAEDDLALRAEPSLTAFMWKRLTKGTQLISLEPQAAARSKLGIHGQWLPVQDPTGQQGYVAAWYLSERPAESAPIQPAPPAGKLPTGALALMPTAPLALRTRPIATPETLIRYIPVSEQLVCLEPARDAIARVGVEGRWLRVKDAAGRDGYVAAWFVRYASGLAAPQEAAARPVAPGNGGPLKVRVTAEGTALRRQPVISHATLIKRMPLGTELVVLEPNGEGKIGRNDQWLQVRDPAGAEGVVAAWFVGRYE